MARTTGSNRLDPHATETAATSQTRDTGTSDSTSARRADVVAHEKDEHGGIKIGSAFFGWLTATGMAVLLTAILVAAGAAIGLAAVDDLDQATDQATNQAGAQSETIGWVGAIVLLVVVFLAYLCGGYVAGRMARLNGLLQGLAVWLWAVVIAIAVAVAAAVAGSEYDVLAELNNFPRLPINEGDLGLAEIIAIAAVAVASLLGALLGGLAGMRFHRKVDKTGLGR